MLWYSGMDLYKPVGDSLYKKSVIDVEKEGQNLYKLVRG